eukprot:CAMPEP_0183311222 /NCGR_PEP_ID=MMETSP0160_2-20130417/35791_1 /TAXON_ID=2839 ORGANISM="Odontella Sinensis, Strain Grunow 1884" /NCGR_SAMPLE_ID=MMETSP0160_2 /ASSEMBLY_ACC=CAM_ASM_000250 /LENGTH=146 /DNA_ID=CAMNT_0025475733 /DNA_START=57 /DNA_END=497 /DNA_ORIENTATION=+
MDFQEIVRQTILSISGIDAFNDSTPQHAAMTWLLQSEYRDLGSNSHAMVGQRYILALLFFETGGPGWTEKTGFLGPGNECEWVGVKCKESTGVVTHLSLAKNNLTEIWGLVGLEFMDLEFNVIVGEIPPAVCDLESLGEGLFEINH